MKFTRKTTKSPRHEEVSILNFLNFVVSILDKCIDTKVAAIKLQSLPPILFGGFNHQLENINPTRIKIPNRALTFAVIPI